MSAPIDRNRFNQDGWLCVQAAVPAELCARLVEVLERELDLPVHDAARWDAYRGSMRDLLPVWGHQAQWDIRQHPNVHRIFAMLWGTEALWVTLDSCRFTPPWRQQCAEQLDLHWDHDPWDPALSSIQGVLALTDTAADQGGFRCVPSLLHDRDAWPRIPHIEADGDVTWNANAAGREVVHVPARAGDLIVWNSRLAHGNSRNLSDRPRLAFYVSMNPAARNAALSAAAIESWHTGRCVPWWRTRPGYDRVEPWAPAHLTPLGRRLIGLDPWPSAAGSG